MNSLLSKSGQYRFGRDDLEQIAAGTWDKYPEKLGTLTEAEINCAKKLLEDDAKLMRELDVEIGPNGGGPNGYLNSRELLETPHRGK